MATFWLLCVRGTALNFVLEWIPLENNGGLLIPQHKIEIIGKLSDWAIKGIRLVNCNGIACPVVGYHISERAGCIFRVKNVSRGLIGSTLCLEFDNRDDPTIDAKSKKRTEFEVTFLNPVDGVPQRLRIAAAVLASKTAHNRVGVYLAGYQQTRLPDLDGIHVPIDQEFKNIQPALGTLPDEEIQTLGAGPAPAAAATTTTADYTVADAGVVEQQVENEVDLDEVAAAGGPSLANLAAAQFPGYNVGLGNDDFQDIGGSATEAYHHQPPWLYTPAPVCEDNYYPLPHLDVRLFSCVCGTVFLTRLHSFSFVA